MVGMGRMTQIALGTRVVATLAVLLGLLAMHGLASSHHALAEPAHAAPAAAAHNDRAPAPALDHHRVQPAATTAQHDAAVPAGPGGPACDKNCSALTALCVTILAVVAAAVALALARKQSVRPAYAPDQMRTRAIRPPSRVPLAPPDPVTELCVSRT